MVNCLFKFQSKSRLRCYPCYAMFLFSYHYKLPFDVNAYTFDMCTNKVYLLTYLLTARPISNAVVFTAGPLADREKGCDGPCPLLPSRKNVFYSWFGVTI